jgi:SAM-dependent methyltransferase
MAPEGNVYKDGCADNIYGFDVTVEMPEITDRFATPEVSRCVEYHQHVAADLNMEERLKGNSVDEDNNPGLDHILSIAPQIAEWRALIPISPSLALEPFYHPGDHLLRPAVPIEESAREWLTDQQLGIALRNRMKLKTDILKSIFAELASRAKGNRSGIEALILAGGRGRAPLTAAIACEKKTGTSPHLTLVDIDRDALLRSELVAEDSGFDNLTVIDRDIMQLDGFENESMVSVIKRSLLKRKRARLSARGIAQNSFDMTTAIGIKMYIPDDNWQYQYRTTIFGREVAGVADKIGALKLLRHMGRVTKPGGYILFDAINPNMAVGRHHSTGKSGGEDPDGDERFVQLEITDLMGWKILRTSTELQNLDLIARSGIEVDNVKIIRDPSGFFSLYLIRKR